MNDVAIKKPEDFDDLYTGRFLKAGEFHGKPITLTISDIDKEELQGNDGKKQNKPILSFRGTDRKLVTCKTNGLCLKAMFGKKLSDWVGKRVTLFPSEWAGEPCIRIWGSPDIAKEITVTIALPRKRPFDMTLRKTEAKGKAAPPPTMPTSELPDANDDGRQ